MNYALKLAAAVGLSLPVLFGGSASAAEVTPQADDNPIAVLIGQLVVSGNENTGNADRNQ